MKFKFNLLHIAALTIAAILLLSSSLNGQGRPFYKSEPFVRELGLQMGKLPLTASGLQRAVQSLGDSGVVLISYPGVWDTAGVGAIPPGIVIKGWLLGQELGLVNFEIDDSTGIAQYVENALIGYATEEYVNLALANFTSGLDTATVDSLARVAIADSLGGRFYDTTFVGKGRLQRNRNVALGSYTLYSYNRGTGGDTSDNVAVGYESMRRLTTGHYNTGVGAHTLEQATTAYDNDAFGAGALARLTTGIRNTAIGNFAMHWSQTVSYNVAIGRGALSNLASGGFNTALGINAGGYLVHNSVPFTTGSNNTFLGYATYPQAEGNNNSIVIGYNARGKGSNTTVIGDSNNTATYLYGTLYVDDVEFVAGGSGGDSTIFSTIFSTDTKLAGKSDTGHAHLAYPTNVTKTGNTFYFRNANNDTLFTATDAVGEPGGGITSVSEDNAPVLGGNLDLGDYSITNTTPTFTLTATELSYLDGVTSSIQTQLNTKSDTGHTHTGVYEPANANIQSHISSTSNPHGVTKIDVGLSNVPNTDATNPANITQSASYRFTTDSEKTTWNNKQDALGFTPENATNKVTNLSSEPDDIKYPTALAVNNALSGKQNTLVSGTTIKTINNESLLGSGNITIPGGGGTWGSITGTLSNQTDLQSALNAKQNSLVSGTNIKTINGQSVLGSGNLVIDSSGIGGGSTYGWRYASDFGAVGNGIANDYEALRETFMSGGWGGGEQPTNDTLFIKLDAGKTYFIGGGSFFWNYQTHGVRYLYLDGQGSTIFSDTVFNENGYTLLFGGYSSVGFTSGWGSIPNAYTKGDVTIKLPFSIWNGAKVGDVVWVTTHPDLGGAHQDPDWVTNSVSKGELGEIKKVNADTSVTLVENLDQSYTAGGVTVVKRFFFPEVVIKNLKLKATPILCSGSTKRAIDITGAKNILIENVDVEGFEYQGIGISNSLNGTFRNIKASNLSVCANYGINYGILIAGCQNMLIEGCNVIAGRHGIDIASSYYLPSQRMIIANNFVGADILLGTSGLATHPGVKDILIANNIVYGMISTRSTHNNIIGNYVHNYYSFEGTGSANININNAWNTDAAYNNIVGNVIVGKIGGIQLLTGNIGGIKGQYTVKDNVVRTSSFLTIDSYYGDDSISTISLAPDIIIQNNKFEKSYGVNHSNSAVMINPSGSDTLYIDNFVFEGNIIRGEQQAILVYGTDQAIVIDKFSLRNNHFITNAIIQVNSGATIGYLDVSGNILDADNGLGGAPQVVRLMSGSNVNTLKHFGNTYINLSSGAGQNAVEGTVVNWYRGSDILLNTSGWTKYSVSSTNGFSNDWVSD